MPLPLRVNEISLEGAADRLASSGGGSRSADPWSPDASCSAPSEIVFYRLPWRPIVKRFEGGSLVNRLRLGLRPTLLPVMLLVALGSPGRAGNWPQWRGPEG